MSQDESNPAKRKRRRLRVPVDEVPRPTSAAEADSESGFDGGATVEIPAFPDDAPSAKAAVPGPAPASASADDEDDGIVASWMTPSSAGASPPAEPDAEAMASVEVDLDAELDLDDGSPTAVGDEAPEEEDFDGEEGESVEIVLEAGDSELPPPGAMEVTGESVEVVIPEEPEPPADDEEEEEPAPAPVVAQVVVQRVVSVAVGTPAPEPEPSDEDEDEDEDEVDSSYEEEVDEAFDDEFDGEIAGGVAESEPPEVSVETEPGTEIAIEVDEGEDEDEEDGEGYEDEEPEAEITVSIGDDEEQGEDDEPAVEAAVISEAELADALPDEEEGELEELVELEEHDRPSKPPPPPKKPLPPAPPAKPPAPPEKPAPPAPEKPPKPAAAAAPAEARQRRKKVRKKWFEELFNDDYLRTVSIPHPKAIARQCDFIEARFGLAPGATILDVGCGLGHHAVELTRRGYLVVGLDLSLPMLSRAADEAKNEGLKINFLHADMREMSFEGAFDAVLCWNTTLGYFDDETNKQFVARLYQALKPRGLLLLDVVNRDYVLQSQPNLVWFEGDGAVVMEETKMNFITSRLEVKRTVILDNGRQRDWLYSVRLYSLHELGQILHQQGFRVVELTGREAHPGVFFGSASPKLIILAERRPQGPGRPSMSPSSVGSESAPANGDGGGDGGEDDDEPELVTAEIGQVELEDPSLEPTE